MGGLFGKKAEPENKRPALSVRSERRAHTAAPPPQETKLTFLAAFIVAG